MPKRATISKSVSKGKYDAHRAAEFKDRANERRLEIMRKIMELEARIDQADQRELNQKTTGQDNSIK